MKLLERYIAKTVLASIGLVTLMLAGLQVFMLFVSQLGDMGNSDFGMFEVTRFVLLQMPEQVYLFFPMACLLGSLTGLGIMANHRELIVMRAAGMSIGQITVSVLKAALLLIIFVTVIGETIVPKLSHLANDQRAYALSGGQTLRTAQGVWLRYQNDFITIGRVLADNTLENVWQFHFDDAHHLRFARKIERISFVNGVWQAFHIAETTLADNQTVAREILQMPWEISVKPSIIGLSNNEPEEMSLHELRQYLRVKTLSHQAAPAYELAYWQRLIQPFTNIVMMILAIPFIFGPLRSSTMGSKLLAGATMGFGFHIINRFFGPVSQVFQWPPVIAALGPTILFALIGIYLILRVK